MSFQSILGVFAKPATAWIKGNQERKTIVARDKGEIRKIEFQTNRAMAESKLKLAEQGQSQDFDLDRLAMQNMKRSWKSEVLMFVLFLPIVMAFFGEEGYNAKDGFDAIALMPEWYQWCIIGIIVQTFGLRGLLKTLLQYGANKAAGTLGLVNRATKAGQTS